MTLAKKFLLMVPVIGMGLFGTLDKAQAQSSVFSAEPGARAVSVQASVPYGLSLSLSQKITPVIDARLILNPEQTLQKFNVDSGGFAISAKPKLGYYGLFGDWYVGENSAWRLSLGLASTSNSKIEINASKAASSNVTAVGNGNGLSLTVGPKTYTVKTGETYTYNGVTYTMQNDGTVKGTDASVIKTTDIESAVSTVRMHAKVRWPSVMPYVGFGYNSNHGKDTGWAFVADVGVFIGKPKVDNPTFSNSCNTNVCSVLNQELTRQGQEATDKLRNETNKLPVMPKIAIGVEYRF